MARPAAHHCNRRTIVTATRPPAKTSDIDGIEEMAQEVLGFLVLELRLARCR